MSDAERTAMLRKVCEQSQAELVTLVARLPDPYAHNVRALLGALDRVLKETQS